MKGLRVFERGTIALNHRTRIGELLRSALLLLVLLAASSAIAQSLGEPLSLQGFSGGLNTPTAWTHGSGSAHLLYTNEEDPRYRTGKGTDIFAVSASPLRFLEAGMRLTEAKGCCRDLSLNAKLQLPLQLLWPELPVAVAIGAQDFGGAVPFFQTRYAVASGEWKFLRGSLGYGTGPDRMEGVFGSAEVRPWRWFHLLGEYDGAEWNAGVRLLLPAELLEVPLQAGVTLKTSLSNRPGYVEFGATVGVPLALGTAHEDAPVTFTSESALPLPSRPRSLESLHAALLEAGFENVRVGTAGDLVAIEYENNVYSHSELDGLAVALSLVSELSPNDAKQFSLTLLRRDVALVELQGDLGQLQAFEGQGSPELVEQVRIEIRPTRREGVSWLNAAPSSSNWRAQLALSPGIRPFIGTEVGVFDAVLSIRPELTVALWRGASVYARWDVPFAWTSNFNEGKVLAPYKGGPRLDYGLLYQAIPIVPKLTALVGAGVFRIDSAGLTGELLYTPGSGAHAFGLQGAVTRSNRGETRESLTASYRFTLAPLDAVFRVQAGQFYFGDRGVVLEASRYFGDVQFGAFYARAEHATLGAFLSLPLTPRTELKPGLIQLRGARRWETELYTVVHEPNVNRLRTGVAIAPTSPYNLEATYLDGSRLTASEIRRGLRRARQAAGQLRGTVVDLTF